MKIHILTIECFSFCKVSKTDGGKCGFVLSADEGNSENARNLAAHFEASDKNVEKKASQNNERLLHNVREAEQTYNGIKKRKEKKVRQKPNQQRQRRRSEKGDVFITF